MKTKHGLISAACASLACVALAAPPALAGSTWGPPQQVSTQFGRGLEMSDNGQVMAWIRTNSAFGTPIGPVRTAVYRGAKKGWSRPGQMPGTAETKGLQLSGDGKSALVVSDVGLGIATADGAGSWTAPTILSADSMVPFAQMSSDARTVVWVSESYVEQPPNPNQPPGYYPPSYPPSVLVRTLKSRTMAPDGQWGAETVVGEMDSGALLTASWQAAVLSGDGTTLVWLAAGKSLVGAVKSDSGTWSPATVIRKYAGSPEYFVLRLSANGERLAWVRDSAAGIFTSTRSGQSWSLVGNVTVDAAKSFAMAPNALSMAWGGDNGKIKVASLIRGQWRLVAAVGAGRALSPDVMLGDETLCWISGTKDVLRSSSLKSGTWKPARIVSKDAFETVLSSDGKMLAWAQAKKMRILSAKR